MRTTAVNFRWETLPSKQTIKDRYFAVVSLFLKAGIYNQIVMLFEFPKTPASPAAQKQQYSITDLMLSKISKHHTTFIFIFVTRAINISHIMLTDPVPPFTSIQFPLLLCFPQNKIHYNIRINCVYSLYRFRFCKSSDFNWRVASKISIN